MASDGHDATWFQWVLQFGWGVLVLWFARLEKVLASRGEVISRHETKMSAHSVRIDTLESRATEDRQSIRDGFGELKAAMTRIENKLDGKADK